VILLDLLRVRHENGRGPTYVPVTFVRYDACPAIVVVDDGEGRLLRVAREEFSACLAAASGGSVECGFAGKSGGEREGVILARSFSH
jgi:hypothetical protein